MYAADEPAGDVALMVGRVARAHRHEHVGGGAGLGVPSPLVSKNSTGDRQHRARRWRRPAPASHRSRWHPCGTNPPAPLFGDASLASGPTAVTDQVMCLGVGFEAQGAPDAMAEEWQRNGDLGSELTSRHINVEESVRLAAVISSFCCGAPSVGDSHKQSDFVHSAEVR